jgi:hypothetical protein
LTDGQELELLVSVVRAYDVPVRRDVDPLAIAGSNASLQTTRASLIGAAAAATAAAAAAEAAGSGSVPREAIVHSYVEARFQVRIYG